MDYTNYNIIKILPNIYLSKQPVPNNTNTSICANKQISKDILSNLNIKYLININNTLLTNNLITLSIGIENDQEYIDSSDTNVDSSDTNIDLNITNDFICNALQNNANIIIADTNNSFAFLIMGAFLLKYNNLTYTECIYWLFNKMNFKQISKKIVNQLFIFYIENDK
jgi:hypothetical protein